MESGPTRKNSQDSTPQLTRLPRYSSIGLLISSSDVDPIQFGCSPYHPAQFGCRSYACSSDLAPIILHSSDVAPITLHNSDVAPILYVTGSTCPSPYPAVPVPRVGEEQPSPQTAGQMKPQLTLYFTPPPLLEGGTNRGEQGTVPRSRPPLSRPSWTGSLGRRSRDSITNNNNKILILVSDVFCDFF